VQRSANEQLRGVVGVAVAVPLQDSDSEDLWALTMSAEHWWRVVARVVASFAVARDYRWIWAAGGMGWEDLQNIVVVEELWVVAEDAVVVRFAVAHNHRA
jgi:hypothetical protein